MGLVAGLARPSGNLTGASMLLTELNPKRLELLSELVPQAMVIALLVNPNYSGADEMIREAQEAARANARRETRTTPRYSPISTPNSTACRSAFHRAFSGKVKDMGGYVPLEASFELFSIRSIPGLQRVRMGAGFGLGFRAGAAALRTASRACAAG